MVPKIMYRLENSEGCGPYCCHYLYEGKNELGEDHHPHHSLLHPNGWELLSKGEIFSQWRFCFESLDNLVEWFGEWINWLMSIGFVIRAYECSNYRTRGLQSAFLFESAKTLETIQYPYIFRLDYEA